jgi:hypothetical protein
VFPHGPHGRGLGLGDTSICQWTREAAVFLRECANFTAAHGNALNY